MCNAVQKVPEEYKLQIFSGIDKFFKKKEHFGLMHFNMRLFFSHLNLHKKLW